MNSPTLRISKHETTSPAGPVETWLQLPCDTAVGLGSVRADAADMFAGAGLRRLDDFLEVPGEPLMKPGLGSRYRARLRFATGNTPVFVYLKRFGVEKLADRWRRRWEHGLWMTPGEHESRIATTLHRAGISVPAPLAWGWQDRQGVRYSFVVLESVPGEPAQDWVAKLPASNALENWEQKRVLIERLAELARRFHGLGFCHRDFYLNHVFVTKVGRELLLSLIDLQRIFQPRWRAQRWRIKDLAQLNYSATGALFSRTMRLRFAYHYFGVRHLSRDQKRLLQHIIRKTRSIVRRHRQ